MFLIIRLITDALFILLSYATAYLMRFRILSLEGLSTFPFQQYADYLFSALLIHLFVFYFLGMYKTRKGFLVGVDEFIGSFFSVSLAWGILIILTFIRGEYEYSRPVILLSWPISFLLITVARQVILRIELWTRAKGYGGKRAVVIGTGELARSVAQRIREHPSYGVNFLGFVGGNGDEVMGEIGNLDRLVNQNKIQIIYVADPSFSRDKLTELADFCDQKGIALGTI